jgi:hypothetical protein
MPEEEPKIGSLFLWLFLFKNIFFINYIIFNIELIQNYNYIFFHETLYIATVFFYMFFFLLFFFMIVSKILFINFIFLILSWLKI